MAHDNSTTSSRSVSPAGWASRLSDVWDVGLVVLGSDRHVDFVNSRARTLVNASDDREFEERWRHINVQLDPSLRSARSTQDSPLEVVASSAPSRRLDLRIQVYQLDEDDCAGYLLILQHTERAAAIERALRDAVRSRSLTSLFRDTAHDLKDVLNVISMNVELMSRSASHPADGVKLKQSGRSTDVVRREIKRLERALDTLLDRSIIEREAPQALDLNSICDTLIHLIGPRASRQHVEVHFTTSENVAEVKGFPDRIHGALLSLIVNALDAMPNGGRLQMSVSKATTIHIRLCDTGPGISADMLPDIWRLHFTTKPLGTGIGLYVTRSIIEAHGGTIRYEPNSPGGSCFVIELPPA
jgi:signal transduction histidine kinase